MDNARLWFAPISFIRKLSEKNERRNTANVVRVHANGATLLFVPYVARRLGASASFPSNDKYFFTAPLHFIQQHSDGQRHLPTKVRLLIVIPKA